MKRQRYLILLMLFAFSLGAQTDRGVITGSVTDPAGAFVPSARITVQNLATNVIQRAVANAAGEFTLPSVPVGEYRVTIEMEGFKSAVRDRVVLAAGSIVRVDTKLEVGDVQQTVEVMATAAQLATDSAKITNSVTTRMIDELPTVVSEDIRNPFDLAMMTAGVRGGGDNDFRIAGGQAGGFGVFLDGASAGTNRAGAVSWASVNSPSLDAITEFTVETNGFKAEFGRAGGGMITFVSKSGGNNLNGTVFDFVRNNAFDARGFFNRTVPVYRQHDFGATAGGPVYIPKVYNGKDKTFFFFSYEGFRNRVGGDTTATAVPPKEFYDGDFSNLVSRTRLADGSYAKITLYDPATTVPIPGTTSYDRTPFPGNKIPTSRFNQMSKSIMDIAKAGRLPNRTDVQPGTPEYLLENYWQSGTTVKPVNKYSIKLDHIFTDAHRVNFYYGYTERKAAAGPSGPPGIQDIFNSSSFYKQTSPVYRGSWDYTVSPTVYNRFFIGINGFKDTNQPFSWGQGWKAKGICMPNVFDCDANSPMLNIGDYGQWGGYGYSGSENPVWSINEQIMVNKGKHSIKAGYQWEFTPYNGIGMQNVSGRADFNRNLTALPADRRQGGAEQSGGAGFADFVLGYANSGYVTSPRYVKMQWNYQAMFIQDDWRVTNKLTLMLGLRYEFNLPPMNGGDECADFDPTRPNPGADNRLGALVFCGTGEGRIGRRRIPPGWWGGYGPRLGLAYQLDSKTVLRMSGSRSFAPVKTVGGSAHAEGFALFQDFPNLTNGVEPRFILSEGLPPYVRPPFIDPTFSNNQDVSWWQGKESSRLPEVLGWTASIQRQINPDTMVEVGYSAQIGTHLTANLLKYNQTNMFALPAELSIFTVDGRNLLNRPWAQLPADVKLRYPKPYTAFNQSLERSLRPFPQYNNINTGGGGGDHSGHSSYHSMVLKLTKNYSNGLLFDGSYVISKMLTDSDSAWGSGAAIDHYNRRLEKALSGMDRTHEVKLNWLYDLPIGKGRRWVNQGILSQVIGGWRVGTIQQYMSGVPLGLGGAFGFPGIGNRPIIDTYEGWRAPIAGGKFDPYVDRYIKDATLITRSSTGVVTITRPGFFPVQEDNRIGNMTKNNPKMRGFPHFNENVSLAKTFYVGGENRRLDFRAEGFNLLNRTIFANPNMNLGADLGLVRNQANKGRQMQFALKYYW